MNRYERTKPHVQSMTLRARVGAVAVAAVAALFGIERTWGDELRIPGTPFQLGNAPSGAARAKREAARRRNIRKHPRGAA